MSSGTAASRDESSLRSSSTSEPLKMGMPRHLRENAARCNSDERALVADLKDVLQLGGE